MNKLTRRGVPVLGINALIISNDKEKCERFIKRPPLASKVYSCIMDAAVIREMINLYKPKAIYFIFSKSERAGKNNFSAVSEYSLLYNIRLGVVGSVAQFEAVKRVYGGEVSLIGPEQIRRDIAKVRNIHSQHAAALAKRIKSISDGCAPFVVVFGCSVNSYINCENVFDTYFSANGIRLKIVYVNLSTASVRSIREKILRPDLMVIPMQADDKIKEKLSAILSSAAYRNIPYMTYSDGEPVNFALPDNRAERNRLEVAEAIYKITTKK